MTYTVHRPSTYIVTAKILVTADDQQEAREKVESMLQEADDTLEISMDDWFQQLLELERAIQGIEDLVGCDSEKIIAERRRRL